MKKYVKFYEEWNNRSEYDAEAPEEEYESPRSRRDYDAEAPEEEYEGGERARKADWLLKMEISLEEMNEFMRKLNNINNSDLDFYPLKPTVIYGHDVHQIDISDDWWEYKEDDSVEEPHIDYSIFKKGDQYTVRYRYDDGEFFRDKVTKVKDMQQALRFILKLEVDRFSSRKDDFLRFDDEYTQD